jgi:hypothetical protein
MPRAVHRLTASGRTQSGLSPRDDIRIDPAPVVRYSEHSSDRRISQHPSAPASRSGSPPGAGDEPSQTRVPPSSTRSSWRPIPTRRSNRSHRASRGSHHHRRQFGCRSDPSRPIRRRRAHHHRGPQVRHRVLRASPSTRMRRTAYRRVWFDYSWRHLTAYSLKHDELPPAQPMDRSGCRVTPSEPWRVAGTFLESSPAFV